MWYFVQPMNEHLDPTGGNFSNTEREIERKLRPLSFDDFTGQAPVLENLKIFVEAAKMRGEALDHVLLHGPPGLGKTTLAKKLSKRLQLPFLDTDLEIEKKENKSVSEIFKNEGELYFRMLETEFLTQLNNKAIIACGGGIPMHNNNMSIINTKGISIYLKASANYLANRLKKGKQHRPLIANILNERLESYIKKDLQQRNSFYALSHHTIIVDNKSTDEVLREVNTLIRTL